MKKLTLTSALLLLFTTAGLAQTSFHAGLNGALSTSAGFWGINPSVETNHKLSGRLNAEFRLNGFFDLSPDPLVSGVAINEYHRSIYSDFGLNYKLIDRTMDWDIAAGATIRFGKEQYFSSASWRGDELKSYKTEQVNLTSAGFYLKNSIGVGKALRFNLTLYRFTYLGEYMSFGPSIKF